MLKQEFLNELEDIVSMANNEKDYIDCCMIEDVSTLLDDYEYELEETN